MPFGLQQQQPVSSFCIPKSAATPQHGQKAGLKPVKEQEPRSFRPRPGH